MSVHFVLGLLLLGSGLISVRALLSSEELSSEEIEDACVEETGVNIDLIKCLPNGPCPEDPKLKCFVKCALATTSVPIEEDGTVDPDALLELFDDDEREAHEASVRLCAKVRGTDACDTTFQTFMCWAAEGLISDRPSDSSEEGSSEELTSVEKQYLEWHMTCAAESGVDEDLIECIIEDVCPDDQKLKCYLKCVINQMGVPMRENGEFDMEALTEQIEALSDTSKEKYLPIIRKCAAVKGADACDTAYLSVMCWFREKPHFESFPESFEQLLERR